MKRMDYRLEFGIQHKLTNLIAIFFTVAKELATKIVSQTFQSETKHPIK